MFVRKLSNIKYGVFCGNLWGQQLAPLKKYNLFFGWNGSGKTTLSNLFAGVEKGELPEGMQYRFEADEFPEWTSVKKGSCDYVKVFNSQYIHDIVTSTSGLAPIYYIGKEHRKKAEELERVTFNRSAFADAADECKEQKDNALKEYNKFCSTIASLIKAESKVTFQSEFDYYDKNKFAARSKQIYRLREGYIPGLLSSTELHAYKEQKALASFPSLTSRRRLVVKLEQGVVNLKKALVSTIESDPFFKTSSEKKLEAHFATGVQEWGATGRQLHDKHGWGTCLFCGNSLAESNLESIRKVYSDSYLEFVEKIAEIERHVAELQELTEVLAAFAVKENFLPILQSEYNDRWEGAAKEVTSIRSFLLSCSRALSDKKKNVFAVPTLNMDSEFPLNDTLEFENLVEKNIELAKDKKKLAEVAQEKIAEHIICLNLKKFGELYLKEVRARQEFNLKELRLNRLRLKEKKIRAEISNYLQAGKELSLELKAYLGRGDLQFKAEEAGYQVVRKGKVAGGLSEAEKTAVAFLYFLKSLRDETVKLKDSIVVVDDPVSSLDSNSMYRTFSFLTQTAIHAKQLIVLTHNFVFFDMMRRWLNQKDRKEHASIYALERMTHPPKGQAPTDKSRIVMASSVFNSQGTEYAYLFKKVYFCAQCSPDFNQSCYPVMNIARRFIETFLGFKYPNSTSFVGAIQKLNITEEEKQWVYVVLNDLSHGMGIDKAHYDFSLKAVTNPITHSVMKVVEKLDPVHFNEMKKLCGVQ